jgi:hypothetical protein
MYLQKRRDAHKIRKRKRNCALRLEKLADPSSPGTLGSVLERMNSKYITLNLETMGTLRNAWISSEICICSVFDSEDESGGSGSRVPEPSRS